MLSAHQPMRQQGVVNKMSFVYSFSGLWKISSPTKKKKKCVHDQMNKCTASSSRPLIFYNFAMLDTSLHMPAGYISG